VDLEPFKAIPKKKESKGSINSNSQRVILFQLVNIEYIRS